MKCPVCKKDSLQPTTLAGGPSAESCTSCGGTWISSRQYFSWLRLQSKSPAEEGSQEPFDPAWDTRQLKICPECGRILSRYRILPGVSFNLDRCNTCQGVWFDAHEWEAFASHNLQTSLSQFFTRPWQEKINQQEKRLRMEKLYTDKFGATDYARLCELRSWVRAHPRSNMLLAFLLADDPYK